MGSGVIGRTRNKESEANGESHKIVAHPATLPSPKGATENSPALQRRESQEAIPKSRFDAREIRLLD